MVRLPAKKKLCYNNIVCQSWTSPWKEITSSAPKKSTGLSGASNAIAALLPPTAPTRPSAVSGARNPGTPSSSFAVLVAQFPVMARQANLRVVVLSANCQVTRISGCAAAAAEIGPLFPFDWRNPRFDAASASWTRTLTYAPKGVKNVIPLQDMVPGENRSFGAGGIN